MYWAAAPKSSAVCCVDLDAGHERQHPRQRLGPGVLHGGLRYRRGGYGSGAQRPGLDVTIRRGPAGLHGHVQLDKDVTAEEVNAAFKAASEGELKGVLGYSDEPLVSIDHTGNPNSSVVDSLSTAVMEGRMVKVLSWYDNEWGYSNRVVDLALYMGERL